MQSSYDARVEFVTKKVQALLGPGEWQVDGAVRAFLDQGAKGGCVAFSRINGRYVVSESVVTAQLPAVYALKLRSGPVDVTGKVPAHEVLAAVSFGVVDEHFLKDMQLCLSLVGVPTLEALSKPVPGFPVLQAVVQEELLSSTARFATQVGHTEAQIVGQASLDLPVDLETAYERENLTKEQLKTLLTAVGTWIRSIQTALKEEATRQHEDAFPMAEIHFWRDRASRVGALYEQLQLPAPKKVLELLQGEAEHGVFADEYAKLSKLYLESRDNAKFLATLERHLKILKSASLVHITETLPSLINALKMVWVVSRYFNTKEAMEPLLSRISFQLCRRVEDLLQLSALFPDQAVSHSESARLEKVQKAATVAREAHSLLVTYEKVFAAVSDKLATEHNGERRWDFSQERLFSQTTHLAQISEELEELATTQLQFYRFLNSELKEVTGDVAGIDALVSRVSGLTTGFLEISKPFEKESYAVWSQEFDKFRADATEIEHIVTGFLDSKFKQLRSSESAFQLLQKFRGIESRPAINAKLNEKFSDIMRQYRSEVERIDALFDERQANPPIQKLKPPVAGAIVWARELFHRVKKPVMLIKEGMPELLESTEGKRALELYLSFGKRVIEYERNKYETWRAEVEATVTAALKQSLLVKSTGKADSHLTYAVNFSEALDSILRETKALDQIGGFDLPPAVLNLALQSEKYRNFRVELEKLVLEYGESVGKLNVLQRKILASQIDTLDKALAPGLYPLNWNSLAIPDFLAAAAKAVASFKSVKDQVEKTEEHIEEVIRDVETAEVVRKFDWELHSKDIMDVGEFYQFFESYRVKVVEDLVKKYESLSPLLVKIEEITVGTKTGSAPSMREYYLYFERKVFNAITVCLIRGMAVFNTLFTVNTERPPILKIRADFNPPEVVIGALQSVFKVVTRLLQNTLHSAAAFTRWMDTTCRQVPIGEESGNAGGQTRPGSHDIGDEAIDRLNTPFTFYKDISANPALMELTLSIQSNIQKVFQLINRFLKSWKKYDSLWDSKKRQELLDAAANDRKTLAFFDSYLNLYRSLAAQMSGTPVDTDIGFVRVDCSAVITGIRVQALDWVEVYGGLLRDSAFGDLRILTDNMTGYRALLEKEQPSDLEELKQVLNVIQTIRETSMDVENLIAEIEEKFRTLELNECPSEGNAYKALAQSWSDLKELSTRKDQAMTQVKAQFREVTQKQVATFQNLCRQFLANFKENGPGTPSISLEDGVVALRKFEMDLEEAQKTRENLLKAESLFLLPLTSYPELVAVEKELKLIKLVYDVYLQHAAAVQEWSGTLWTKLDVGLLSSTAEDFERRLRRLGKEHKELEKDSPTFKKVEEVISAFKVSVPLIQSLKHESIKPVHWGELYTIAKGSSSGATMTVDMNKLTLAQVFQLELHRFPDAVNSTCTTAMNEMRIEKEVAKIEGFWKSTMLEMGSYKGDRGFVLKANEEIKQTLEDHVLILQSIGSSKYALKLLDTIKKWEKNLFAVSEIFDVWLACQRKWQYLEGIFIDSDDIRLQLPAEAERFDSIHKQFVALMGRTYQQPNVLLACIPDSRNLEARLVELKSIISALDYTQKNLTDYLDMKRSAFPRFYFISDDELLSILGSSDPQAVQPHTMKLFDNCKALTFVSAKGVGGMTSDEGEKYAFQVTQRAEGAVEDWMTKVDQEMRDTLQALSKEGVYYYAIKCSEDEIDDGAPSAAAAAEKKWPGRIRWLSDHLGMVVLAGTQIWWTWSVENAFKKLMAGDSQAMTRELAKQSQQLTDLVDYVRAPITFEQRNKVNTLIILDVHARDIVAGLVNSNVTDSRDFAWESQLRFYWNKKIDDILIKQCTGQFRYMYEYQGLNGRLVITPLTDRCVMTLTTALTFFLGGSPAGPAGTGKTETVKDLSKALSQRNIVLNCGEGLDSFAMGTFFSGLAESGFWGCFDEFNRITAEVLSVVSAQVKTIQLGLMSAEAVPKVTLLGREIKLRKSIGYFITMNPGYAGRAELPDNLKAMFRPVAMIVPDLFLIASNILMSNGFGADGGGATALANKMVVLYSLAAGQLSKQYHYDFKLRALKSVLVMAGDLKRASPDLPEDVVLMRALRDMNMPKFVAEDVPLFQGLLSDLFPGLDCPRVGYPELKTAIEEDLVARGMKSEKFKDVIEMQVDKVMQLYETMLTRHTTMVVGRSMGGKSVVIETLANAQKKAFNRPTKLFPINPKAITVNELYGVLDPATRDWTDGLLSKVFRDINQPMGERQERRYIVFDGHVDAIWVENLNSVMDDNKILTLTNGERIRLEKHCALLFEVFDLQYASPATISRCGMVYVDDKNLGPGPFYDKWCTSKKAINEKVYELLDDLYDKYIGTCIQYVFEGKDAVSSPGSTIMGDPLPTLLPRSTLGTDAVVQLCSLFDSLCVALTDKETGAVNLSVDLVENMFIFCVVWSIGAVLDDRGRAKFEEFVKKIAVTKVLPKTSLYDHVFDVVDGGRWIPWDDKVPKYVPAKDADFARILVPTIDTTRYSWLRRQFSVRATPAMFVGESGTAKTVTIQRSLEEEDSQMNIIMNVNFSSRTSSKDFQRSFEDTIVKRTGRIFGPEAGKTLHVFIDDLSMPKIDTYGTQQPLALLKLLIERGFIYERGTKELDKIIVKDTQYVVSMQPPGGGRNSIDPRVISLFSCVGVTFPSTASVDRIYSTVMRHKFTAFDDSVKEIAGLVPAATLQLHRAIAENLIRSPSKFHYIFNLRDLSRVYQGLWQCDKSAIQTGSQLVRLWRNECMRVYADRLIDRADKEFVAGNQLPAIIKERFQATAAEALAEPLLFGDFKDALDHMIRSENPAAEPRVYEDFGNDWQRVKQMFESLLENYNIERKPVMNLVMFVDAMEHILRIHRIIRLPRGNALLVGVGGSGKQSFTRFATYVACYNLFEVTLSRGYNDASFREDLKKLYALAVKKPVTFMFTDAHVVEEGFLEYINNILTVGLVPALFTDDEKEGLMASLRAKAKTEGVAETHLWTYTVNHIRNQLHVVLAMSPAGEQLRVRCRSFPGLVGSTTIDWFFPWPRDALKAVARHMLSSTPVPEAVREGIEEHICEVHLSVTQKYALDFERKYKRKTYATPKNFLDYLGNYGDLLAEFRRSNDALQARLGGGLTKLTEAAEQVSVMSEELAEKKIVVDRNAAQVALLIQQISEKSVIVSKRQAEANDARSQIEEDSKVIEVEKAEADEALAAALPALEAASQALNSLDKKDITEIKSMASPPPAVATVCTCVMILRPLGKEDETAGWAGAKAMLSDVGLLRALFEYKKDEMKERQIRKIKQIFQEEGESFEGDNMLKVSKAGYGLLQWVKAMVQYYSVAKTVEPKKRLVAELSLKKETAERNLANINSELAQLAAQIETLTADEREQSAVLRQLTEEADAMRKRLTAASKLIDGLGSEKTRWTKDLEEMGEVKLRLVGDCLLAASFLSYVGPFNHEFRQKMVYVGWQSDVTTRVIPVTQPYKLEKLLVSDVEVSLWNSQGLPMDELSVQNGILTSRSTRRFPLCVDPQMQAVSWIRKKEEGRVTVKTFSDDYIKHLELAIQYGKAFVFVDVEEDLDPMIDVVLEKAFNTVNGQKVIKLGDNSIEWNENFTMYLTSKMANPRYSPEVMGKVSMINYTVTMDGLAAQLLNVVVGFERPDLEAERTALVQSMNENRQVLKNLEDTLLRELASSRGSLLDNEDLINTLQTTKSKATEIAHALEVAKQTAVELEKLRNTYARVAKRGSILYFAMQGLSAVSEMYEYSLGSYLGVFETALKEAKPDRIVENRLRNMRDKLTQNVYDYTCMSIFERHKLLFAFRVCCMILEAEGDLVADEYGFFIKGNTSIEKVTAAKPYDWISDAGWKEMQRLNDLGFKPRKDASGEALGQVIPSLLSQSAQWKEWYDLEQPENAPLPEALSERLTPFQRLMVTRCLRTDRIVNAVKLFIVEKLGEYYVQPPYLVYDRIFAQSSEKSPVVFILSPGADPQSDVQKLGEKLGFVGNKFRFLALGQGMGPVAQQAIELGCQRGFWVMLQNCHLLTSWLRTLEKILETTASRPHKDFRLWLTTMPTSEFPLGILQKCLKVVTEPSEGLKLNMKQSYAKISESKLNECPHPAFQPLIYVLGFFHAIIQDRRKFGKIGWNVMYDFNESDFAISFKLLNLYLTKAADANKPKNTDEQDEEEEDNRPAVIPWATLKYLIGDAMYGGRVSDDYDRRVLNMYLIEFMGDRLFAQDERFFFSRAGGFDYTLPERADLSGANESINGLPITQTPAVFGLHANAEITYLAGNARSMWLGLISMQTGDTEEAPAGEAAPGSPTAAAAGAPVMSARDIVISNICNDILKTMDAQVELKYSVTRASGLTPTEVVLCQEIERYNALADRIVATLSDLRRALKGEIGMSADLDEIGSCLYNGFLPPQWRRLAPLTEKPLAAWMEFLSRRHALYAAWAAAGEPPAVLWLSGLHIPESHLSALVQTTCRAKGWALDKSQVFTEMTTYLEASEVPDRLEFGTYIEGLYLEGADWDAAGACLTQQQPKQLVARTPVMKIIPIEATDARIRDQGLLATPVYYTQQRRNAMGVGFCFEASVRMPAGDKASRWVLQGVALFLNIDI